MSSKSSNNKTIPTPLPAVEFISRVEHPVRRKDADHLLAWFEQVTGFPPVMWGTSIVGYGRYHYVYDSGRSGDSMMTGFSPRKASLSIYIMPGYHELDDYLQRLGKHRIGKSCLYVNKLDDIDIGVLEEIVRYGVDYLQKHYQTWAR
ncbi:DUF1801 domain-containing protein [Granulosicoccus sp. 3-233]|uniref:DUF1801 domain-containing protein n=1 Tax=Granulosicoccus sp. 3-233 TaxID=3417969 RepID=UPI003D32615A